MKCTSLRLLALSLATSMALLTETASAQSELHKIRPVPGAIFDQLGLAVAIDGNTALVAAPKEDTSGPDTGGVYVVDMTTWAVLFHLLAPDAADGDSFGDSVAINGQYFLVGASLTEGNGHDSGAAYLFDRATGTFLRKLEASDGDVDDIFGISVALSGEWAIVGAPGEDDVAAESGAVYVFDTTTGLELSRTKAPVPEVLGRFGYSVSAVGNRMMVGANRENSAAADGGAAYLLDVATGAQLFKLTAPDAGSFDRFGSSVSLSGAQAFVGSHRNDSIADNAGAAYMFDGETGQFQYKLTASDAADGDLFGVVAVDGGRALVGATGDDDQGESSGSAYVFSTSQVEGNAYCFGDGTGAACPCSAGGAAGEGCQNTSGGGAVLAALGAVSITNDTFRLQVSGAPGQKPGLILRGGMQVNGGLGTAVGDGLLCTSGQTTRSQVQVTSAGHTTFSDFQGQPFGASSYGPGVTANYQFWYRDPLNTCTGAGFNFSNAWAVTWLP